MKRRSFLALASIAPIGLAHSAEEEKLSPYAKKFAEAQEIWIEKTTEAKSGVFVSSEGTLRLEVSLIEENEPFIEETITTEYGEETVYTFEGKKLPNGIHPHSGVIKRFRFYWDNKEIPIEKRFWNDFGGCLIEQIAVKKESIPTDLSYAFGEHLDQMEGPKIILSADGGTALIEWHVIDGCCGHRAAIRWIISKNGVVMRHRHTTPNPC